MDFDRFWAYAEDVGYFRIGFSMSIPENYLLFSGGQCGVIESKKLLSGFHALCLQNVGRVGFGMGLKHACYLKSKHALNIPQIGQLDFR